MVKKKHLFPKRWSFLLIETIGYKKLTFWWQSTSRERITNITTITHTVRDMIDYRTLSIDSTLCCRTRINTVEVLACLCRGTFRIGRTLWPTCNIWVAEIFRDARTCGCPVSRAANRVLSAWRWAAGIYRLRYFWTC